MNKVKMRPMRRALGIGLGLLAVAAVLAGSWFCLFRWNRFFLTMELQGQQEIVLEYGHPYIEPGARAVLRGTKLWKQAFPAEIPVLQESAPDDSRLGEYRIRYRAEFYGLSAEVMRMVRIVDTQSPEIILVPDQRELRQGERYTEAGYTARDNYDGDLTALVERREADGEIIYTVSDSSGNTVSVRRELPFLDVTPPELLLEGGETLHIPVGTRFTEPGFTASDTRDGDLTDQVAVEAPEVISPYTPGAYEIRYIVSDSAGNVATAVRQVLVEPVPRPEVVWPQGKVIYLTFDDGPGLDTVRLLNILKAYDVKATFFVTDSGYPEILRRIVEDGHSIAIHTMSHNYMEIYDSMDAYFADLLGMQAVIEEATGVQTHLMRFPGGSSNTISRFRPGIMTLLAETVENAGFCFFDWNVDSNDAGGAQRASEVRRNVIQGVQQNRVSVVLQHDIHYFSVDAVEGILQWGLENGYTFLPLDMTSPPMHHGTLN